MSLNTNDGINRFIRETIKRAGSRYVTVEAVTKGGEVKRFTFSHAGNLAAMQEMVTAQGAAAAATRAFNNPNLYNVNDVVKFNNMCRAIGFNIVRKRDKESVDSFTARRLARKVAVKPIRAKAWRCFDLDRVLSISANGETHVLRHWRGN